MSYQPLHDPGDIRPPVALAAALASARKLLAHYETANIYDHQAMVQAAAALEAALRSVIVAVDTEAGERP